MKAANIQNSSELIAAQEEEEERKLSSFFFLRNCQVKDRSRLRLDQFLLLQLLDDVFFAILTRPIERDVESGREQQEKKNAATGIVMRAKSLSIEKRSGSSQQLRDDNKK